jgi:DNA-binding MarR family transcriptional regulator
MARLFHEVAAQGLHPLGISPEHFPLLVELWFGQDVTRASLAAGQEAALATTDSLLEQMHAAGLLAEFPADPDAPLALTARANDVRDAAIAAARRANQSAAAALTDVEMAELVALMNRVIDALQAAKAEK